MGETIGRNALELRGKLSAMRLPMVHRATINRFLRSENLEFLMAWKCPRRSTRRRALPCGPVPPRPRSPQERRIPDWRVRSSWKRLAFCDEVNQFQDDRT